MSSKRGRKRNDSLPPNRARDVQRAFRARRAAHLESLQERVDVLEDENARLRDLLQMPPSMRPMLGRGPTGKDKPANPSYLSHSSLELSSTRHGSPSTEPSSAKTASSGSPAASEAWGHLPLAPHVVNGIDDLHWGSSPGIHDDTLHIDRSPPTISLPKTPYSLVTQQPPLRHLSHNNDDSFYPSPQQYHSDRSSNGYTPSSSPPVFLLRDSHRDNDTYPTAYPIPTNSNYTHLPSNGHHQHSVTCELPLPSHNGSPIHSSRGSSADSLNPKRSLTTPDTPSLVRNSFGPQLHPHLRHPEARSSLSHNIPSLMHHTDMECRSFGV